MDAQGEVNADTTLASRAGLVPMRLPIINAVDKWKSAPKITRRNFEADWVRFSYFVEQKRLDQSDALANLPYLLDDELFPTFFPVFKRSNFTSLLCASEVLRRIVGTKGPDSQQFLTRKWAAGRETIAAFAFDLQSMAATLEYPLDLLKSQFINGLSQKLACKIRAINTPSSTIEDLSEVAERIQAAQEGKSSPEEINAVEDLKSRVEQQQSEIAALKANQFHGYRRSDWNNYGERGNAMSDLRCFRCQRRGHFQRNCPKNGLRPVKEPARY